MLNKGDNMNIRQKNRDEIDELYKWNLKLIYENDDAWYEELKELKREINNFKNIKKELFKSANHFYEVINKMLDIERKISKLFYYAHLSNDQDTQVEKYQKMYGKIIDLNSSFSVETSFFTPEILKHDFLKINDYIRQQPKLEKYKHLIEEIFRFKPHTLNENEEKLISEFTKTFRAPSDIYEVITDTDFRFGTIKNESGVEVELTNSNFSLFLENNDRNVRKEAFKKLYSTYHSYANTLAETLKSDINVVIANAKVRNYSSALESSLFEDEVPVSVYENLIKTVNNNLEPLYQYYDFKKKALGLDELHLYDVYAPIITSFGKSYSFEEAKELVMKSLSILGDDYVEILNRAFDERWIDVYNNVGKRSGGYSSGGYDTKPYILLNYEGKFNDVSTLAHELGHSMHSYFSIKNNPYHEYQYKIFVAEVASTVNELLLSYYMYDNTNDKKEKMNILNQRLELFRATIYRQTMFAEFEKEIYDYAELGEVLTTEIIESKYYSLVSKYFGPGVVCDNEIKDEWSRIPHFYYNFYVYKYATGLSAACKIASEIISGNEKVRVNYLDFLKTGGSLSPIKELNIAGVDMNDPEVIESSIKMFEETLSELKNIYYS